MAVNYTTLLGLAKPQSGTEDGQWGDIVNDQLTDLLDSAIAGATSLDVTSEDKTLSDNDGAADQSRAAILIFSGTPGTTRNIVAPSRSKVYAVINGSNGSVVIKGSATTGVTIPAGFKQVVAWNGSDFVAIGGDVTLTGTQTLTNKTLTAPVLGTPTSGTLTNCTGLPLTTGVTGTLPIANGGTGQTTASGAINALLPTQTGNSGKYLTTNGSAASWATVSGGGDVTGPASSTDNAIARFDGTTGKLLQNTGLFVTDVLGDGSSVGIYTGGTAGGENNVIFGYNALSTITSGDHNIALGYEALQVDSTSGFSYNIGIGFRAGADGTANADDYICIGNVAGGNGGLVSDGSILIGGYTEGTTGFEIVLGYSLTGKGSNTAYIGGSSGVYNEANSSSWATTSDQRIKKNIVDSTKGLAEIKQVQVRNFNYKSDEEMPLGENGKPLAKGFDSVTTQTGFIAQELQAVLPEAVKTGGNGVLSVQLDPVVYALINAVKELSAEVESLKAQLNGG